MNKLIETSRIYVLIEKSQRQIYSVIQIHCQVSSWGGSEIKTVQFLVPRDIDPEVFARLTSMLTGIFRTSNPIRGK